VFNTLLGSAHLWEISLNVLTSLRINAINAAAIVLSFEEGLVKKE
jgi:hypothetical protein